MHKQPYVTLEIETVEFGDEDIITSSGGEGVPEEPETPQMPY